MIDDGADASTADGKLEWKDIYGYVENKFAKSKHLPKIMRLLLALERVSKSCLFCWFQSVTPEQQAVAAKERRMQVALQAETANLAPAPQAPFVTASSAMDTAGRVGSMRGNRVVPEPPAARSDHSFVGDVTPAGGSMAFASAITLRPVSGQEAL
jgi:hypothetical protein